MTTIYPGGKNSDGVYHAIINQLPPHNTYVEPFLGSGAILRLKKPAPVASIAIDADAAAVKRWKPNPYKIPNLRVLQTDALDWLECEGPRLEALTLVYLDPPYLLETRFSKGRIYKYELTDDDHRRLLSIITKLHCMVAISGYWSVMYDDALHDWRAITYQAGTRGGVRTEYLWTNYPEPLALHDYRYLGKNFRERELLTRKKKRLRAKLRKMKPLERYALLDAIQELWT